MNKICIGCGQIMQNLDEDKPGYTPNLKSVYCRRCFRLKNYGERKDKEEIDEEKIFAKVNKSKGIAFFLVDFLNINQKTISLFNKIKIPKVLVISKSDTLRRDMKPEKIKLWLEKVYKIKDKILFISNKPNFKSNNILKIMEELGFKVSFIMGITNAGKSTFINKLLKEHGLKKEILTSSKPNTTLDFIKIKIGDLTIIDTPGFTYENDDYLIEKEIKPISYLIKKGTTLIINGTYRIYFEGDNKVIFYGTTSITRKYQEAKEKYVLNIPQNNDIVIPGIGFLNIKEACQILSNQEHLEIRLDSSEVTNE